MVQISGESSPPLSKDEELRDIGHSMSMGNLIWGANSVTVSYLIHYDTLLQNATAILLQNAKEVYYKKRQVFYYKMRQFYYKMRQLLQIATILLQNETVITKCDVYYKLRQYTVQQKNVLLLNITNASTELSCLHIKCIN